MSPEYALEAKNKALLTRWFEEVWNRGRADLIDEMRAPDTIATGLSDRGAESRGDGPFRIFYSNLRETFPDLEIRIEDMIAEGDRVVARICLEGTHTGIALGPAPTGQTISFSGMVMVRIANGRIVQAWNSLDQLGLLKQMGAIPAGAVRDHYLSTRP